MVTLLAPELKVERAGRTSIYMYVGRVEFQKMSLSLT